MVQMQRVPSPAAAELKHQSTPTPIPYRIQIILTSTPKSGDWPVPSLMIPYASNLSYRYLCVTYGCGTSWGEGQYILIGLPISMYVYTEYYTLYGAEARDILLPCGCTYSNARWIPRYIWYGTGTNSCICRVSMYIQYGVCICICRAHHAQERT